MSPRHNPRASCLAALSTLGAALLLAGCGGDIGDGPAEIKIRENGDGERSLGFPAFATKNTTRVAGSDSVANAAAVASAVYPGSTRGEQPQAVTLVDRYDWRAGIAASALVATGVEAPILLTDGDGVPDVTRDAIESLRPTGTSLPRRAQAVRIGGAPAPEGLRTVAVSRRDPFELAAAIDAFRSRVTGKRSSNVVVVSAAQPRFAMPAAGWAAKSGDAVLFTHELTLPRATRNAIARHKRPHIYVLGPAEAISDRVVRRLERLGSVTRVDGSDPVANAIEFARFSDRSFGWGVRDPGHGLVIANASRPLDAAAAAPLSASGTYGPLLLVDSARRLPVALRSYLLDIQPGYQSDPARGVYNHAWLIGDEATIDVAVQAQIDRLIEIEQVKEEPGP